MKTIKKYWTWICGGVVALLGIFALASSKRTNKLQKNTAGQINDNNARINNLQGKVEVVDTQRKTVKQEIAKQKQVVSKLEKSKQTLNIKPTDAAAAKENIIKNVNRGKKKKK